MTQEEFRARQKRFFQKLKSQPLDLSKSEDRELHQPIHDAAHDPVTRLHNTIDFSDVQSVQLVAGFRGTGKTTEFSRLEKLLWESGRLVIRVDLDDYLDMHSPVDVREFLLVLVGAISKRLADERLLGDGDELRDSLGSRAWRFLNTDIIVKELSVSTPQAGILPGLGWKVELLSDPTVRERVRDSLAGQLPAFALEVRQFHDTVLAALRKRHGDQMRLVVIVDSLEHLRGGSNNQQDVHRSVRDLFLVHSHYLELPETHMVFSVPAFLALKADNLAGAFMNGAVQAWPACHITDRDAKTLDRVTLQRLIALVEKRVEWRDFLADDAAMERIVVASGGYLRDLFNMLIEALLQSEWNKKADPEKVIKVIRRNYLPLYADERAVLQKIMADGSLDQLDSSVREVIAGFLDSHLLLCYMNDDFWYAVHPLIRDELGDP